MRQLPKWLADPLGPLSIPPAYLPKLLPWLWRFWRAGAGSHYEASLAAQAGLMTARRDRMGGADAALRHAGTCCARTARWNSMKAMRNSRRRCPAGRRATASASNTGICAKIRARRLSARPVAALHARHLRARLEDGQPIRRISARRSGTMPSSREPCSCAAMSAWRMPSQERIVGAAQATGAPSWRGELVVAAGAWSHLLARQFGDRIPLETERGYNTTLPTSRLRREAPADLLRATASSSRRSRPGCASAAPSSSAASSGRPISRAPKAMLEKAKRFLPGLDPAGGREWMGYRPSLPDSLPVIGRARVEPRTCSTPSATAISA